MRADAASARLWGLNHQVLTTVLGRCTDQLSDLGLDTKEFFVLAAIEECRYPAELATQLVIPKPTVTVYLRTLEKAGLVRREIDREDLRRHRLALTAKGAAVLKKAMVVLSAEFDQRLGRLSEKERQNLMSLLEKLLD